MIGDLDRRVTELRFLEGIEKVEHVPYPTGDQFWVRFNHPLDINTLEGLVKKHNYVLVKFASLPSKLPRAVAEILWDGVTYVVAKEISGLSKLTSFLGLEPEGIAKIAHDLHGPYEIFIATEEGGIQLLYEYLGLPYVPPAPPKPVAPAKPPVPAAPVKPAAPAAARPIPTTLQPATPASPTPANPTSKPSPPPTQQGTAQVPAQPTAVTQLQPKKDAEKQASG